MQIFRYLGPDSYVRLLFWRFVRRCTVLFRAQFVGGGGFGLMVVFGGCVWCSGVVARSIVEVM